MSPSGVRSAVVNSSPWPSKWMCLGVFVGRFDMSGLVLTGQAFRQWFWCKIHHGCWNIFKSNPIEIKLPGWHQAARYLPLNIHRSLVLRVSRVGLRPSCHLWRIFLVIAPAIPVNCRVRKHPALKNEKKYRWQRHWRHWHAWSSCFCHIRVGWISFHVYTDTLLFERALETWTFEENVSLSRGQNCAHPQV